MRGIASVDGMNVMNAAFGNITARAGAVQGIVGDPRRNATGWSCRG